MSEYWDVFERFKEICPKVKVSELGLDELKKCCRIAFKIIGFTPSDLDGNFDKAWGHSRARDLYEFIFDVWRIDTHNVRMVKGRLYEP